MYNLNFVTIRQCLRFDQTTDLIKYLIIGPYWLLVKNENAAYLFNYIHNYRFLFWPHFVTNWVQILANIYFSSNKLCSCLGPKMQNSTAASSSKSAKGGIFLCWFRLNMFYFMFRFIMSSNIQCGLSMMSWVDPYPFIESIHTLNKRVWIDSRRHWWSRLYVIITTKNITIFLNHFIF